MPINAWPGTPQTRAYIPAVRAVNRKCNGGSCAVMPVSKPDGAASGNAGVKPLPFVR